MSILDVINPIAWVLSNLILAYIALGVVVFVIMYYALFDPKATTGGKLIFRFMLSLVGIIFLVFIGIFVDPIAGRSWSQIAPDVEWWRPLLRLLVYGYVAFTVTSLAVLLVKRKWFPSRLRIAPEKELIKVRHETSEIPIVKTHPEDSDVS